jgi:hypothetical protein
MVPRYFEGVDYKREFLLAFLQYQLAWGHFQKVTVRHALVDQKAQTMMEQFK